MVYNSLVGSLMIFVNDVNRKMLSVFYDYKPRFIDLFENIKDMIFLILLSNLSK